MSSVPSFPSVSMLTLQSGDDTVPASDHFQVVFGMQGRLELMLKGRRHAVQAGRVLVIPPGEQRRCAMRSGAACLVLRSGEAAHRAALAPLAGQVRSVHPSTAHLMRYLASRRHADDAASQAATIELLIASLAASTPLGGPRLRRSIDWEALDRWVDERLDEPLAVADLAAQVHLSAPQFALRCRAELGMSPMALVRRRRLAAARRCLDAGMPVDQVALQCGYQSPSALTAALRREPLPA
jgi:AraC-like DNA-binding protein